MDWWYFTNKEKDCLSLYSVPIPDNSVNMWNVPNLLLQKIPASEFTATIKITFIPDSRFHGEKTGLIIMGLDYAALSFENTQDGFSLSQIECKNADTGNPETVNQTVTLKDSTVYLRINMKNNICSFQYSTDNKKYSSIGKEFKIREGKWIGAKIGTYCLRPIKGNDGGKVEIDWFRVIK